jgi:hypothetical protein
MGPSYHWWDLEGLNSSEWWKLLFQEKPVLNSLMVFIIIRKDMLCRIFFVLLCNLLFLMLIYNRYKVIITKLITMCNLNYVCSPSFLSWYYTHTHQERKTIYMYITEVKSHCIPRRHLGWELRCKCTHSLAQHWGEWSASCPSRLFPVKESHYPLNERLLGP